MRTTGAGFSLAGAMRARRSIANRGEHRQSWPGNDIEKRMWLLPWLAAAVATVTFEPITLVAAGRPLALLRTDEGQGLTVSASCRTRAGTLACQAVSALTSASRRSPEGARR